MEIKSTIANFQFHCSPNLYVIINIETNQKVHGSHVKRQHTMSAQGSVEDKLIFFHIIPMITGVTNNIDFL